MACWRLDQMCTHETVCGAVTAQRCAAPHLGEEEADDADGRRQHRIEQF